MRNIFAEKDGVLFLGRQGEHLAAQVRFPAGNWPEVYGPGSFQLLHRRCGDAQPYPVAVTMAAGELLWDVTRADTAAPGDGRCELQYYAGETLVKSRIWQTRVLRSLSAEEPGEIPEPEQAWVEQVLAAAAAIEGGGGSLPSGGTAGQVLMKTSAADGDAAWQSLPVYAGVYDVTPLVAAETNMHTAGTYLDRDVVVREIPYAEASNPSGGTTVTIGG